VADDVGGEQIEQSGGASAGEEPAPDRSPVSWGQALVALGAVAIIVSLFLNWLDLHVSVGTASLSRTGNATKVPVQFLFDKKETANDPTILIILIPAAALGLLGALIRRKALAFIAGGVSLVVAGLYAYQLDQSLGILNDAARGVVHFGLSDVIGIAPYVCAGGALIMLVGAFMLHPTPRRDDSSADLDGGPKGAPAPRAT
jgi:hypothetical protein